MIIPSLVGYTSSRKPIYQFDTLDMDTLVNLVSHFTPEDHFDAFAVFSYLQLVYWRRHGEDSLEFHRGSAILVVHMEQMTNNFRSERRKYLGLATVFHVSDYGRKHCVSYLQEIFNT